jgi:transposase
MLDQQTRQTILTLEQRGHSARAIARTLGISRSAVRKVCRSGSAEVPRLLRPERASKHRARILQLLKDCKGNLIRVHECLQDEGADFSYQALTAFCRRHEIGTSPKKPTGHYHFEPAQEMQHDTSPHDVSIDGKVRRVQTASLVLCYSRILFFQFYPRFRRFECKVFLTEALRYMDGVCAKCMIDNTHVVVLKGTGPGMVPVPEMEAFARRFGFDFIAHEVGDANRSARVERPFAFIEGNYLANRRFESFADANRQAKEWCDKVNATYKKHIRAVPRELYAVEHPQLRRLPIWVPDPYQLHQRIVDLDGHVTVHTNRYSVPYQLMGRRVEVRETKDRIIIYDGPREVTSHERQIDPLGHYFTQPKHRLPRGHGRKARGPSREESEIRRLLPEINDYVDALKRRGKLQTTLALRRLLRMAGEYPREPLLHALRIATHYGLHDLERLETMVLRAIAKEYFLLPDLKGDDHDPTHGGAPSAPQEPPPAPYGRDPA